MSKSKMLLTKLTAKSVDFYSAGGGGTTMLTSCDVAAALSKCNEAESMLLRAKYAGDSAAMRRLAEIVAEEICTHAKKIKWESKDPTRWERLVQGALAENFLKRCGECKGTGNVKNQRGVVRVCSVCGGTGNYKPTPASRAKTMMIARATYYARWEERWEWASQRISEIEISATGALSRGLG